MQEINNAGQENKAAEQFKAIVKQGNAADQEGEICPYCSSTDTALLDDRLDELTNTAYEAWLCGTCGRSFRRDAKLGRDGKTVISSRTFAGARASAHPGSSSKRCRRCE